MVIFNSSNVGSISYILWKKQKCISKRQRKEQKLFPIFSISTYRMKLSNNVPYKYVVPQHILLIISQLKSSYTVHIYVDENNFDICLLLYVHRQILRMWCEIWLCKGLSSVMWYVDAYRFSTLRNIKLSY